MRTKTAGADSRLSGAVPPRNESARPHRAADHHRENHPAPESWADYIALNELNTESPALHTLQRRALNRRLPLT
jgi:hypothetical protein